MTIHFACPHCQQKYTVAESAAGKQTKCKKCAAAIIVPAATNKSATPPAPSPEAQAPPPADDPYGLADLVALEASAPKTADPRDAPPPPVVSPPVAKKAAEPEVPAPDLSSAYEPYALTESPTSYLDTNSPFVPPADSPNAPSAAKQKKIKRSRRKVERRVEFDQRYGVWSASPFEPFTFILFKFLFGLALVFGVPYFQYITIQDIIAAKESRNWPSTQAVIESIEIKTSTNRTGQSYTPKARFTYEVNGQRYEGTRLSYAMASGNRKAAEEIVARFPRQSKRPAYYNPDDPSEAVLITGVSGFNYLGSVILIVAFLSGVYIVYGHFVEMHMRWQCGHLGRVQPPKVKKAKKKRWWG